MFDHMASRPLNVTESTQQAKRHVLFSAEHVSVRLECCRTTAKLQLAEEKVVAELLRLTQFDPAWKIKAFAIKGETL